MFNKFLATTAATFFATTHIALAAVSAPYFGFSTGLTNNTASNGGSYRGMPLSVIGGYSAILNQTVVLGGELFATLDTITFTNNNAGIHSLTSSYGYGISFLPGFLLADHTIGLLRIGFIRTRFPNIGAFSNGTQLGLGLQTNLLQNWDVRTEYDYTSYNMIHSVKPRSDAFNLSFIYKIE